MMKMKYLIADILSKDDRDMKPSNLDIIINTVGRKVRKSFSAIPGRNPWATDLINSLHKKKEAISNF